MMIHLLDDGLLKKVTRVKEKFGSSTNASKSDFKNESDNELTQLHNTPQKNCPVDNSDNSSNNNVNNNQQSISSSAINVALVGEVSRTIGTNAGVIEYLPEQTDGLVGYELDLAQDCITAYFISVVSAT